MAVGVGGVRLVAVTIGVKVKEVDGEQALRLIITNRTRMLPMSPEIKHQHKVFVHLPLIHSIPIPWLLFSLLFL